MSENQRAGVHDDDSPTDWHRNLTAAGWELPPLAAPLGAYVPAKRAGNLVFTSGCLPVVDGVIQHAGKVGVDVTSEDAARAAELCALNGLTAINSLVGLDQVVQVVRVTGFVSSAPGFAQQPSVVNGASQVLAKVFGDAGTHARSAVGVSELPLNAPVEIELVVEVH
jgi:enamine deaminase RidA (YjgF/YER057c/UK114 family)